MSTNHTNYEYVSIELRTGTNLRTGSFMHLAYSWAAFQRPTWVCTNVRLFRTFGSSILGIRSGFNCLPATHSPLIKKKNHAWLRHVFLFYGFLLFTCLSIYAPIFIIHLHAQPLPAKPGGPVIPFNEPPTSNFLCSFVLSAFLTNLFSLYFVQIPS
jgi:hypothetical protein